MQAHTTLPISASFLLLSLASGCAAPAQAPSLVGPSRTAPSPFTTDGESWRDRLVDPVTSPTSFESPIIETNIEPMYIRQGFPSDSIFGGGGFSVIAVQLRYAVNDRLAIIATKDGWIDLDPDAGGDESGFADIAAGVKYAWIDEPEEGLLVTPGITFELPSGEGEVFQGNGDGLLRPFISAAKVLEQFDLIANAGYSFPLDDEEEVSFLDYHVHLSREVTEGVSPLVELNGITYTSDGEELPVDFEGGELINLGATDVSGNSVFTGAVGVRWRATPHVMLGASFEAPLGGREDLFDDRIVLDVLIH